MTTKSLKTSLEKVAADLLAKVDSIESIHDRLDIFKAVSAFYLGTAKVKGAKPEEDTTGTTFGAIRNRVNGTQPTGGQA